MKERFDKIIELTYEISGNDSVYYFDDHKDKEILKELVKERFDKIIELTNEIIKNDLAYYFKGSNNNRKRLDYVNNGIKHFEKIRSGEMNLEEAKKTADSV